MYNDVSGTDAGKGFWSTSVYGKIVSPEAVNTEFEWLLRHIDKDFQNIPKFINTELAIL